MKKQLSRQIRKWNKRHQESKPKTPLQILVESIERDAQHFQPAPPREVVVRMLAAGAITPAFAKWVYGLGITL